MNKSPLFESGRIVATPGAIDRMEKAAITHASLLDRHFAGDWGDVNEFDSKENDFSVREGFRIWSIYKTNAGRLYVITEADRSATTILKPDEY